MMMAGTFCLQRPKKGRIAMRMKLMTFGSLALLIAFVVVTLAFRQGAGSKEWAAYAGLFYVGATAVAALIFAYIRRRVSRGTQDIRRAGQRILSRLLAIWNTILLAKRLVIIVASLLFLVSILPIVILVSRHPSFFSIGFVGGYTLFGTFMCVALLLTVFCSERRFAQQGGSF